MNTTPCGVSLHELLYLLHQQHSCEHVARCQLHYCMQCIVLAAEPLANRALYNAPSIYTRSIQFC